MTVLILFYTLFYYKVIVASPLPHLAVNATNKEQSENERLRQKFSRVNSLAAYTITLDQTA